MTSKHFVGATPRPAAPGAAPHAPQGGMAFNMGGMPPFLQLFQGMRPSPPGAGS